MTKTRFSRWLGFFCLAWVLAAVSPGAEQVRAADGKGALKFQVQLIWGTNGDKPPNQELKEVESRITDGLKAIFKWKNYFEVTQKSLSVPRNGTQRLKLSDKCEIEVQLLGNSSVEVRLVGEGKCVYKGKEPITPGRLITIAGEAKNDTAWFVVLKAIP